MVVMAGRDAGVPRRGRHEMGLTAGGGLPAAWGTSAEVSSTQQSFP